MSSPKPAARPMPRAQRPAKRWLGRMRDKGIDLVRIGWCDAHGILRGKTLAAATVPKALANGIGIVSTIALKDTSDRTA